MDRPTHDRTCRGGPTSDAGALPAWKSTTAEQTQRWDQLLRGVAENITPGPRLVVVDGDRHAAAFGESHGRDSCRADQNWARLPDRLLPAQELDVAWLHTWIDAV